MLNFDGLEAQGMIGIDLGTTNSVVSILEDGKPKTIPNKEGRRTTPSVVAWSKDGEVIVGDPAIRQMVVNPTKTFYSVKRFIGTEFKNRKIEAMTVPYVVKAGKHGKTVFEIDKKTYPPEFVSAEVLKALKRAAEEYLGTNVTEAVITVPAYFDDTQRQATIDAGKIAGLNVLKILNEPTAAALVYGSSLKHKETIAVYDLGGGTFDFTILKIGEESLEVIATGGNTHLGGDNFDEVLMTMAIGRVQQEHGLDLTKLPSPLARLKEACQQAKIELSAKSKSDINLPFLTSTEAGPVHFQMDLTREEFERAIGPILNKTTAPIEQTLKESGMGIDQIDKIILVGGSTRIPLVQRKVEDFFKKPPLKNLEIDEIVSHGAAIQCAMLKSKSKVKLQDVVSLSLGVETVGDKFSAIIKNNSPIPVSVTKKYVTVDDNQSEVEIVVRQGQESAASKNKELGRFIVENIPLAPAGKTEVAVTFELDGNGILKVTGKDSQGHEKHVRIENSGNLRPDEIKEAAKEIDMDPQVRQVLNQEREALSQAIDELPEENPAREAAVEAIQTETSPEKLKVATKAIKSVDD
jgi:molecular chaperone DnaK